MKHCSKCLLPETHETIKFDKKALAIYVQTILLNKEYKLG